MFRFQYGVTTKASRKLTWEVFSNWRRWNEFANVSGDMNWREGRPWEAGSRLDIEVLDPVKTVVSHVITNCQPGHKVGWIDHALGVVLAQWVSFEEQPRNGTRVHTLGRHRPFRCEDRRANRRAGHHQLQERHGTKIFDRCVTGLRKQAATEQIAGNVK